MNKEENYNLDTIGCQNIFLHFFSLGEKNWTRLL